jgi:hypothetical protein
MKAIVSAIVSGARYQDQYRRIELRFHDTEFAFETIRIREDKLGIVGLKIDDELDVSVVPQAAMDEFERQLREGESKQGGCAA